MKLFEILRFEIDYRFRRPSTWLFLCGFILLAFMVSTGMLVEEAERAGDLHANGPGGLAFANVIISMLGLAISAALFSGAALRDLESGMHSLFATSPITKNDYLGGRFLGALVVNVVLISVVPIVLIVVMQSALIDPELLGPFRLAAFLQPYFYVLLPNVLFTGAILFSVAVLTRRSLPVFASAGFLFIIAMVIEEVVADGMGSGQLGAIAEPFGFSVLSELWEFWTPHEKNSRLIGFGGALPWNRLLWSGIAILTLGITRSIFRMDSPRTRNRRGRIVDEPDTPTVAVRLEPRETPAFNFATRMWQTLAIAWQAFRELIVSRDFLLISVGLFLVVMILGSNMTDNLGAQSWPLTQIVAPFLGSFLPATIIGLLTAFYAGELVWRERDARFAEINDANPVPDWALFGGKFIALASMLVALRAVLMLSALILQLTAGYFRFEIGLYLKIVFGLQLADCLIFAALAMLVHVVVNNKYFGHLLVVICFLFTRFAERFGITHNLLAYGNDSGWVYSDISGFGPFLTPVLWFKLYWAGWALLLAVLGAVLWTRGRDHRFIGRLRLARQRFTRPAATIATIAVLIILSAGGYVYYNTNVLSDFRTAREAAEVRAEYERRYARLGDDAQPTVSATKLHVEIYPERCAADVSGRYTLVNLTPEPIGSIHLFLNPEVKTLAADLDRHSRLVTTDDALGHRTYELSNPLGPGESLDLTFAVRFEPEGFPNSDINTSIVQNGTYFDHTGGRSVNHRRWLPLVGYQSNRELTSERLRREHMLPPRSAEPTLAELRPGETSVGRESILFETVIGTSADQTAVAPGLLRRSWTEKGRRYFHYASERPIRNVFAILSARYAVHEEIHDGVHIEILYHPTHTLNVERFAQSARASLDYYRENFGPYPFRQLRIAEFPRYGRFAHAYPGTISYGESFGWLTRVDEAEDFDLPSAVVAHEVAHQWWAQQVVPAPVEGAAVLTEVLSQYGALMVTEKIHGPEMVQRFLMNTRIEYLNRRGNQRSPEAPLLRVTDQAYLVYMKGPIAMYALRHYIGEEPLNAALRRLLEQFGSGRPPYATAADLYRELKASAPLKYHYLLEDLLETITLWNLRTTAAGAEPLGDGRWSVTIDVEAQKLRADGTGKETEVPMNDFVEIGVYGTPKEGNGSETLHLEKHRIRSGQQSITVVVHGEPTQAGIDPDLHLIDRHWTDNTRPVVLRVR